MKKQVLSFVLIAIALIGFANVSFAQGTVTGTVIDQESGAPLSNVAIQIEGTTSGVVADLDGYFEIEVSGSATLIISYLGYGEKKVTVSVSNNSTKNLGKIRMQPKSMGIGGVNIIADRAKERETPVAISNVDAKQIELQLGSRDIPLIMNNTPGVYATAQGGGAGDSRINVRGFDQRNVAVMINGVPVNDMENGWVYWSNWDGVADATSSIQMQRGLSAVNLATPSIGGTMNIITTPAEQKAGVVGRFEAGSGGFMKTSMTGHSGLINNKLAVSASVAKKAGNGVIDGTWGETWSYYLGLSYSLNEKHRLEAYIVGASQRHGQNLYKQNVAAYDTDYAKEIGADSAAKYKYSNPSSSGRLYNQNWSPVSDSYTGQQNWNGKTKDRYDNSFINERENFYHKPLANLNWYAQWTKNLSQFTTVYYSGGTGGGTGTIGKMKWNYSDEPSRIIDYDATIANNANDTAFGILRNSRNNQHTFGGISKIKYKINDNLKIQTGIDARYAKIEHYREVRDLLGGNFYIDQSSAFDSPSEYNKVLGDRIAYNFTNTVNWVGAFIQGEYSTEKISIYGTYGFSTIKYNYTNHFKKNDEGSGELTAESGWLSGSQIKGGMSYRPNEQLSVFGNIGFVSKAPIFDNVINDRTGTVTADPKNEKFQAYEAGALYTTKNKMLDVKANYYYTTWKDRAMSVRTTNPDGSEGNVFLSGMNQTHSGFELEAKYRIIKQVGIGAIGSFGNWEYTNDVSGEYKNYNPDTTIKYNYYVKGLKVGDAPQTQFAFWLDLYPVKGLQMQFIYRYNTNYYANWDPFSRTDETDRAQVWEVPSYGLLDFHVSYNIPLKGRVGLQVFGHVFNAFNKMYISDAVDNSRYNGYYGATGNLSHTANSAEVFIGLPRTFNVGIKVSFQ